MDAPLFPPAEAYHTPTTKPSVFDIDTVTVKEASSAPALRAILVEEAPQMKLILQASQVQTHVSNWSIRSLAVIDLISQDALQRIRTRMLALPLAQRPAL